MFGLHFVLAIIFKLLFNYRVSLILRKYSFYGTLLFIIYEGNIESFAFFFFAECQNLFSANFIHKMANVFMIYFFFLLMVFVIGGMLWVTFHYRKLTKYFVEDFTPSISSVVLESMERSIFPLLFGCVHILLKDNRPMQAVVLTAVEICYLAMRVVSLRSLRAERRLKIYLSYCASLMRLIFIGTFYLFDIEGQPDVINTIHFNTIILYLITGFF